MLANVIVLYKAPSGYPIYREAWCYEDFEGIRNTFEIDSYLQGAVINGKVFDTTDWQELDSKLKKVRKWDSEISEAL